MKQKYYVAIPAYNEAGNLKFFIPSLIHAVKKAGLRYKLEKTFICVNGCTDNTLELAYKYKTKLKQLNIEVLQSEKGMNRAINKIIQNIPIKTLPIVKVDADVEIAHDAILTLLDELFIHRELQVVGGHPKAKYYEGKNPFRHLATNILDIRSRYPMGQIAAYGVSDFHQIAIKNPQSAVTKEFELNSRIYFHGRFYVLRNKNLWQVPEDRIGDDTYLTLDIYKRFGKGTVRIRYDATCFYKPSRSLIGHWKVYKRIFCDTYTLFKLPEFQSRKMQEVIKLEKVKLDWDYIRKLPVEIQFYFYCYSVIKNTFNILFRISPKYTDSLWTYKVKTG